MLRIVLKLAAILVLLLVGRLVYMSSTANPPDHLRDRTGRLAPCPDKPNCVSSLASRESQRVEPLVVPGAADAAMRTAADEVKAMKPTSMVVEGNDYVHAEFTSRLFRFVDDLELVYDGGVPGFQVRSASRSGHSDLGVNRKRVDKLRARLAAAQSGEKKKAPG